MEWFLIIVGIFTILGTIAAIIALFMRHKPETGKEREPEPMSAPAVPAAVRPTPPGQSPHAVPSSAKKNLPWPQNPNFTGRADRLEELRQNFFSGRALVQALHGLAGVGKSAIALQYCWHYQEEYDVIWWLRSEEPGALMEDYTALAGPLGLPEKSRSDQSEIKAAVKKRLSEISGWLLVFDNAESPEDLLEYLPVSCSGQIIITSLNPNWRRIAEPLEVERMKPEEAEDFLIRRTGRNNNDKEKNQAARLALELGYLPLALEQAGAFIEQLRCDFNHYLEMFQKESTRLFSSSPKPLDYPRSVATTFNLSLGRVGEKCLAGRELMKLLAFFAPQNIPLDVIKNGHEFLPRNLADDVNEVQQWDQDLMALNRYSLIKTNDDLISVHRLVQAVLRDSMDQAGKKTWAEAALKIVNRSFPKDSGDVQTWTRCSRLIEHALASARHAEELKVALPETARLLNQAGTYFHSRANFKQAESPLRRALAIDESSFGPEHPEVATDLNNLAGLLQATNRLAEAEPLMRRALAIDESSFGPEHPKVAIRLNNLAALLKATNRLAEAEPLMRRALAIDESSFGPEHPKVATDLNNLAALLKATNRLAEAEPLLRRALAIFTKSLGSDHPQTIIVRNNLQVLLGSEL